MLAWLICEAQDKQQRLGHACHFASDGIALDGRSETDTRGPFACGVHCSGRNMGNVFDQLTLGHTRVTCMPLTGVMAFAICIQSAQHSPFLWPTDDLSQASSKLSPHP